MQNYMRPYTSPAKSMNLCRKLGHDMIGVADRDVVVVLIEGVVV